MKLSWKQISAVLELAIALLTAVLVFQVGVAAAWAERGYDACGGEYLLLTLPVLYYAGKQTLQGWIADLWEIRRGGRPWRKED